MRRRSAIWRDVHINYTEAPVSLLAGYGDGVGIADQTDVREVVGLRQREIAFGVVRWDRCYSSGHCVSPHIEPRVGLIESAGPGSDVYMRRRTTLIHPLAQY